MDFEFRNDIVLEKVAGVNMLIAKRSAWGICPFIVEIGPMEAYFWNALHEGKDKDEIMAYAAEHWKVQETTAEKFYTRFVNGMYKHNYLLNGDEEHD